jgi:asparagine synthase (glutamine-hydrolysing)
VNERAYWSLSSIVESGAGVAPRRFTEVIEETEALLEDAVRRRLVSDVPIAVLLSGGVDSSLVAYMAGRESRVPLQTFSISLEDPRMDEAPQAAAIAKRLGLSHTVLPLLRGKELSLIDEVFSYLDEPFGDYSAIPTYAICKLARTKAPVLLTGDGGDEVFGGYTRYIWGCGWRRLPSWLYGSWRGHKVIGSRAELAIEIYRRLLSLGSNGSSAHPDLFRRHAPGVTREGNLTVLQYLRLIDFEVYLPDDILVKADRMSMANSAELRSPFLDYRLVELSWKLRDNALIQGTIRKRITRELFRRHIGLEYLQLQKYGFGTPVSQWLLGPLREQVETAMEQLADREDLPQVDSLVRRYWPALRRGHKSAQHPIWLIYAFWRWSQVWEKSGARRRMPWLTQHPLHAPNCSPRVN